MLIAPVNVTRLQLSVAFQPILGSFPSKPGLSKARMNSLELFRSNLVDVGLAKLDPVHRFQNSGIVFREDVGGEAILRIVRVVNSLVKGLHLQNRDDWSEDF